VSGARVVVRGASYRYDVRLAMPDVTLEPGDAVACVGPSGCGKSTLLDLVAGIRVTGEGEVSFDGAEWRDLAESERRRRRLDAVGFVFQEFELLDHLTVEENVRLPLLLRGGPGARRDGAEAGAAESIAVLMESAGLSALGARRPRRLSHGERQRVALCRALAGAPRLVLADEPTGSLDPDTARRVLDLLLSFVRERGVTLLAVTHDHGVLDRFDRVVRFAGAGEAVS